MEFWMTFRIELGMWWHSQLTNSIIFQRGGEKPPTRFASGYKPRNSNCKGDDQVYYDPFLDTPASPKKHLLLLQTWSSDRKTGKFIFIQGEGWLNHHPINLKLTTCYLLIKARGCLYSSYGLFLFLDSYSIYFTMLHPRCHSDGKNCYLVPLGVNMASLEIHISNFQVYKWENHRTKWWRCSHRLFSNLGELINGKTNPLEENFRSPILQKQKSHWIPWNSTSQVTLSSKSQQNSIETQKSMSWSFINTHRSYQKSPFVDRYDSEIPYMSIKLIKIPYIFHCKNDTAVLISPPKCRCQRGLMCQRSLFGIGNIWWTRGVQKGYIRDIDICLVVWNHGILMG